MIRRVGRPGLVGLAARTAVVAGTANAMENRQMNRHAAAAQPVPAPVAAVPAVPVVDVTAELTKLADLHGAGALTDEEFAAAKAKLLS